MADAVNPSTWVTNGDVVSTANPLPCTEAAPGASVGEITLNPRDIVSNGDIISATNPLPISIVS